MDVQIDSDYITLGQLLKMVDLVSSGGEAKAFLQSTEVHINGEQDQRRGRKLYAGDEIVIQGRRYSIRDRVG